jgi:hypothetical protein
LSASGNNKGETMNNILQQIQSDLLDQNAILSNTLRKARVLASQLQSQELSSWVSQELDGYKTDKELPDYRLIRTRSVGKWTNGAWLVNNRGVRLSDIDDEELRKTLTTFQVYDGIRTVEQLAAKLEYHFIFSPEITSHVNYYVKENGYGFAEIELAIASHDFEQILDTIKNRLLDFILKLDKTWQPNSKPPSNDDLKNLVSMIIYNNSEGGTLTVFDQRGQRVTNQYNAMGNININSVQDKTELAIELEKLVKEIDNDKEAKSIDPDIAIEAEYHILQAIKEAKSNKPEKRSL